MNNNDSNINALGEKIRTVFYFVDDLEYEGTDGYKDMCQKGKIELRTIVFAKKQRAIYKGGDKYCPMEDETFKRILLRMLDDEDVIDALIQFIKKHRNNLPIASREELGAIIVGVTLDIAENGTLNINEESIKNIIKNYINGAGSNDMPKASKDQYGVVKIGNGINVDNGVISVKFSNLPSTTQDELLNLIYQFFQNKSNLRASTTQYGVVKVQSNGGILVNDGVISLDPNAIVAPGNIPQPTNYSINRFYSETVGNRNSIVLEQNNNSASPFTCDITSLVQNIINNTGGGNSGSNTNIKIRINPNNFHWEISYDGGVTWQDLGVVAKGQDGKDGQDGRDGRDGVDGKDGQDGYTPTIDDQQLITVIEYVINNHEGGQQSGSEVDIEEIVNEVINVLNTKPWGEIFTSSGWSDAINAYLQQIGLIGQEVDEQGNRITKYNYSEMIQKLDEISSKVDSIELFTDENGNMITIEDLYSRIDQTVNNHTAITALEAKLAQWETDGPVVESVWSTTVNKVSNLDDRLTALAEQQASVIDQDSYTLSLLHLTADETSSMASLTSSYGDYFFDENGNPIYEEDVNGNVIYNRDEEGKAIPYTGVILKYLDADGNELPDNHTIDQRVPYKKEVKNGDEITFQNLTDKNGNIIYRQRAIKVYYLADSNGNYIDNTQYVRADDINDGNITWSVNDDYKDIYGNSLKVINYSGNIAYHKKRKFKLRSEAGFITRSNAEDALSEQFAKYNDVQGLRNDLSTVSTKATANSAAVQAIARNTVYKSKYDPDENPAISFLWRNDNNLEVWSSNDLSTMGYHKVVDTSSNAGLGSYVDDKIAQSSIFAEYVTNDDLDSKNYATVQAVTTEKNAAIDAAATATFYESRNNNGTIEFKWKNGNNETWSVNSPGEGWSKVIREQNKAGLSSYVDDKIANSSLSTQLNGIRSEIELKVTSDDVNRAISSATINADKINLNGQTWAELINAEQIVADQIASQSIKANELEAGSSNKIYVNSDDGVYVKGTCDSKINPNGSGYLGNNGNSSAITWETNGSGSIANGAISWNSYSSNYARLNIPDGTITVGDPGGMKAYMSTGYISATRGATGVTMNCSDTASDAELFVFGISGSYRYTTTGPQQGSDMRKKDVIENENISIEDIADAPLFKYRMKGCQDGCVQIGSSAQYWQDLVPEAVSSDEEGYLRMNYVTLNTVASLTSAKEIVKLKEENATLKQRVEALEARLQLIENKLNA